ncbi:hypothetical protein [Gemmatimonas sp.]|uniref:hypothetical protein n=1 Tax=Gemmatimonas sp. TaxID=1962908 RepID=UPI0031C5C6F9|nr:hypothetical protein [Gemmatimonas sp.]
MVIEDGVAFTAWFELRHPALLSRLVLLTGDTVNDTVTAVAARTGGSSWRNRSSSTTWTRCG